MTFDEEDKCREGGFNAYWEDNPIENNPYQKGTEEYDWWSIGWLDAFNQGYDEFSY